MKAITTKIDAEAAVHVWMNNVSDFFSIVMEPVETLLYDEGANIEDWPNHRVEATWDYIEKKITEYLRGRSYEECLYFPNVLHYFTPELGQLRTVEFVIVRMAQELSAKLMNEFTFLETSIYRRQTGAIDKVDSCLKRTDMLELKVMLEVYEIIHKVFDQLEKELREIL